ncbi:hypothetical protein CRM22_000582 [Opisthorchis felineus]|uniref:Uncharacterized protein n=1 Tax=Opisthorchis felineus TaxID=147828 RepID=A0A4S2MKJ7_OPIFE|nr:hypothetical protein CRM22_000582 [Opisthorchis felineus]
MHVCRFCSNSVCTTTFFRFWTLCVRVACEGPQNAVYELAKGEAVGSFLSASFAALCNAVFSGLCFHRVSACPSFLIYFRMIIARTRNSSTTVGGHRPTPGLDKNHQRLVVGPFRP